MAQTPSGKPMVEDSVPGGSGLKIDPTTSGTALMDSEKGTVVQGTEPNPTPAQGGFHTGAQGSVPSGLTAKVDLTSGLKPGTQQQTGDRKIIQPDAPAPIVDTRPAVDAATEKSQLSANAQEGKVLSPAASDLPNVSPGSAIVPKSHPRATDMAYYRSSAPSFNFAPHKRLRVRFERYWFRTNDSQVQHYLEHSLVENNSFIQITKETETKYKQSLELPNSDPNRGTIVNPVIETLPGRNG